jgi:hypothetical protein
MAVISNIAVSLTANSAGVKKGVNEAKASLSGYSKSVKGMSAGNPFASSERGLKSLTKSVAAYGAAFAAAFSVGAIASSIKASLEFVDSQAELAQQLNVSIKELSGLSYISDVVGGNTEALSGSISKMQKLFGNAANGQKAATDTLAKYGLAAKDLIGLPLSDQISILADKFNTLESQEQKMVFATDMFGKSGGDMINMLTLGGTEIDKMINKAEALGVVFTNEMAAKASRAEDAMLDLNKAWQGMSITLATDLAPALTIAINKLSEFISNGGKISKLSKDIAATSFLDPRIAEGERLPDGSFPKTLHAGTEESVVAEENKKKLKETIKNVAPMMLRKPEESASADPYTSSVYKDMFTVTPELGPTVSDEKRKDFENEFKAAKEMDNVWKKINAEKDKEQKAAAKEMEDAEKEKKKILEAQTKELESQTEERERAADVQGGFMISKAGRVAAGGDFTVGGAMGAAAQGGGDLGFNSKDQQIVSELQEQTGYLRTLAAKPNVPVFG